MGRRRAARSARAETSARAGASARADAQLLPSWLEGAPGAWRIRVAAQPGAARNEIVGEFDGCLKIRISAPPIEGRANDEIVRFLAERLEVPRRALTLVAGAGSRRKSFALDAALAPEALTSKLLAQPAGGPR